MKCVVLDTSAIVRYFIPDGPIPENLEDSLSSAAKAEALAISPELAQAEVAQVILKKIQSRYLTKAEGLSILSIFQELPIIYIGHRDYIRRAYLLAHEFKLSGYDALFLELARSKNCQLISADKALLTAYSKLTKLRQ